MKTFLATFALLFAFTLTFLMSPHHAYASGHVTQSTSYDKDAKNFSPNVGLAVDEALPFAHVEGLHIAGWTGVGYYPTVMDPMSHYYYQIKADLLYEDAFMKGLQVGIGGGYVSNDLRVDPATSAHLSLAYKLW